MTRLEPFSYSQRDGEVIIEVDSERPPGSAEVVVDRCNVPTLLQVLMTALRVGGYRDDELDACARICKSNLAGHLK